MKKFNRDNKHYSRSSGKFGDRGPKKFDRGDTSRFQRDSGFERRESERSSEGSSEKRLFTATCSKCGGLAEIPFRPRENKPVYCSRCFGKNDNYGSQSTGNFESRPADSSKNDLAQINRKLDKIMEALDIQ